MSSIYDDEETMKRPLSPAWEGFDENFGTAFDSPSPSLSRATSMQKIPLNDPQEDLFRDIMKRVTGMNVVEFMTIPTNDIRWTLAENWDGTDKANINKDRMLNAFHFLFCHNLDREHWEDVDRLIDSIGHEIDLGVLADECETVLAKAGGPAQVAGSAQDAVPTSGSTFPSPAKNRTTEQSQPSQPTRKPARKSPRTQRNLQGTLEKGDSSLTLRKNIKTIKMLLKINEHQKKRLIRDMTKIHKEKGLATLSGRQAMQLRFPETLSVDEKGELGVLDQVLVPTRKQAYTMSANAFAKGVAH